MWPSSSMVPPDSRQVGAVVPHLPDVVAVEVHLVHHQAGVDHPDQLPGHHSPVADGPLAEVPCVGLPRSTGRKGLLVRLVVLLLVGGGGHREVAAALVDHVVPRCGRQRLRVHDAALLRDPSPSRLDVLADPQPLPLELDAAGRQPPPVVGRDHHQRAVQPEHPLDRSVGGVQVQVRSGCSGRRNSRSTVSPGGIGTGARNLRDGQLVDPRPARCGRAGGWSPRSPR